MELEYIIAIVAGGIFVILLIVSLIVLLYDKNKEFERFLRIKKMYLERNPNSVEYDLTPYDEETARIISSARVEGQLSIDDVLADPRNFTEDDGIEEITGNYNPN